MARVLERKIEPHPDPIHREEARLFLLFAETKDPEFVPAVFQTGKFPGKIFYVDPCSPVNMGRIFIG
jgi:hypothetical protein